MTETAIIMAIDTTIENNVVLDATWPWRHFFHSSRWANQSDAAVSFTHIVIASCSYSIIVETIYDLYTDKVKTIACLFRRYSEWP